MPSSRLPVNLMEGFEKFPRGVSIVPFLCVVRCTLRLCITSISPSGITTSYFYREDILNILGSEESPTEWASSPRW